MAWGLAACSVAAAAAAQRVARDVVCNQLAFSARCRSWAGGARAGHTCSPVPCLVLRTFQRLCLPRPGPVLRAAGAGDAGVWPAGCAGQRGAANQPALPAAGIQQHGAGGCAGPGRLQRLPTPSVAAVRAVHTAGPPPPAPLGRAAAAVLPVAVAAPAMGIGRPYILPCPWCRRIPRHFLPLEPHRCLLLPPSPACSGPASQTGPT